MSFPTAKDRLLDTATAGQINGDVNTRIIRTAGVSSIGIAITGTISAGGSYNVELLGGAEEDIAKMSAISSAILDDTNPNAYLSAEDKPAMFMAVQFVQSVGTFDGTVDALIK